MENIGLYISSAISGGVAAAGVMVFINNKQADQKKNKKRRYEELKPEPDSGLSGSVAAAGIPIAAVINNRQQADQKKNKKRRYEELKPKSEPESDWVFASGSDRNPPTRWRWTSKGKYLEIRPFSGRHQDWLAWKRETISTLETVGYGRVLRCRKYALKNRIKNVWLFDILREATCDGVASHVLYRKQVTNHETNHECDGNTAWAALVQNVEDDGQGGNTVYGVFITCELRRTVLIPGITPSDYINRFMLFYDEVQRMPVYSIHPDEGKLLFINNIHHPDYKLFCKHVSIAGIITKTLEELITEVRCIEMRMKDRPVRRKPRRRRPRRRKQKRLCRHPPPSNQTKN